MKLQQFGFLIFCLIASFLVTTSAKCDDNQIDINSADLKELDKIVWVGPATAEKIIDKRPFDNIEGLDEVSGIGDGKLSDIIEEGLACVEEEIDEEENEEVIEEEIIKEEITKVPRLKKIESSVIFLEDEKIIENEIIYESKDSKVAKILPYAFGIFLIFVIGFLIFTR